MSGIDDSAYTPVTVAEETFEKPSTGSKIMTCFKKFFLAIIAAALLALLVFQICLIAGVVDVEAKATKPDSSIVDNLPGV